MLTTLLASCDPCGHVARGQAPNAYVDLAKAVLARLRRPGVAPPDILAAFPGEADAAAALQFTATALHWWNNQATVVLDLPL